MEKKTCTKCGITKSVKDFSKRNARPCGFQSTCKECAKISRRIHDKANRARLNAEHREYMIKTKYNMSIEQYDALYESQGGVCKTCGKTNKDGRRLYIDHDHKTNKVRGLLCHKCNSVFGCVDDDITILLNLVRYLDDYS